MESHDADAVGGIAVPDGDVSYVCSRFALRPRSVPPTIPVSGNNGLYKRRVFDSVRVDPSLVEGEDVALNRAMEESGLRSRTLAELAWSIGDEGLRRFAALAVQERVAPRASWPVTGRSGCPTWSSAGQFERGLPRHDRVTAGRRPAAGLVRSLRLSLRGLRRPHGTEIRRSKAKSGDFALATVTNTRLPRRLPGRPGDRHPTILAGSYRRGGAMSVGRSRRPLGSSPRMRHRRGRCVWRW